MCSLEKRIRDLIHFYVKENYNNYLKVNEITSILKFISAISSKYMLKCLTFLINAKQCTLKINDKKVT